MKIAYSKNVTTTLLGKALIEHRGARPLREAAKESKISVPTLNRLERGGGADLATFAAAMKWLRIPAARWHAYMDMESK